MTHPHSTTARRTANSSIKKTPRRHSRSHLHEPRTFGERVADSVAARMGSWGFIIGQSCFILAWILFNSIAWINHFDPFPWILLNLCMSTQAMYTGPLVMLSQNRQASKDRSRDDLEAKEVASLLKMNEQQLTILKQQNEILALLHAASENRQETKNEKEQEVA